MTQVDYAALVLALEQTCQVEPDRRAQITQKLQSEGWQATAEFCASLRQSEALQLRPWQQPPCDVDPESSASDEAEAVELLQRMLAAGVSRWHPDPLAALAQAEFDRP
jgi:hypothetical protein